MRWVVAGLLALDVVLIAMHLAMRAVGVGMYEYNLENPWGYGEYYQGLKAAAISIMLLYLAGRERQWFFGVAGLLFAVLLVDEVLEVHEMLGVWAATEMRSLQALGAHAAHVGEVLVMGAVYGPLLLALGWTWWRVRGEASESDRAVRRFGRGLAVLVAALVLFGVVLDVVRSFIGTLGVVEEGGELLVMSLVVGWVLREVGRVERTAAAGSPVVVVGETLSRETMRL